MRQVLFSGSQAVIARMPRPAVAPGSVLVKTHFSLISTGTELASLRPLSAGAAGTTTAERVSDLSNRAKLYLGKAVRDPKKAAQKVAEILRGAMRPPPPPPVERGPSIEFGALKWTNQTAKTSKDKGSGALELVTDESEAGYQTASQVIDVPPDHSVALRVKGKVEKGAIAFGLLNHDKSQWLGIYRVDDESFDETFHFYPAGSPQVTVMITNAGTKEENRVTLTRADIVLSPPDGTGLAVSEMSDIGWNVGYSLAGEVVAVGEGVEDLTPGDLVACAGAGQANHADYVSVKRNLVCRIPQGCPPDLAATTTVGSIALQGVRRTKPEVGETIAVIGLGLIGMLTVQILRASGCRVIGVDLDHERAVRAAGLGACATATDPKAFERLAHDVTGGLGVDATIVTAASKSDRLINQAMDITRRKGRVVVVGDIGLKAERAAFYRKEIDLLMSTSYGPGRYDRDYEDFGRDYPPAYVRWTLNRNMRAYMELIADRRIDVRSLIDRITSIDQAPGVYKELAESPTAPLAVLFQYPDDQRPLPDAQDAPSITLRGHRAPRTDRVNYALVGAGGFGTAMLVPQMEKRKDVFFLRAVVSRDAVRGGNFARQKSVEKLSSELEPILADNEINLVVLATRHSEHADQVVKSLEAGKHVFVEKPLAITWDELDRVREAYAKMKTPRLLMVGFNRRFSPALQALRKDLAARIAPVIINYRLNAGYLPMDHWTQGPEGGGRNIGEACHMYDVFRSIARAPVASISATAIDPGAAAYKKNDNFVATIRYGDGSVGNLVYTASGPKEGMPKERIEVLCGGEAWIVDDFKTLTRCSDGKVLWSGGVDKGHFDELSSFGDAIINGAEAPIPIEEIFETSAVALHVEDLIHGRHDG
ncbi:MAG: bi-domain-containing oxidoreductase [Hyphomonadaceae bacterium]|nr:bi-domain-containing oxidoreductase [Hyphomonadaceae bacterium]